MPLTVDPLFSPDVPPETVTSPDGFLEAALDREWAGVLLTADLRSLALSQALRNGDFSSAVATSNDPNWTMANTGTLTRFTTGGPVSNGAFLQVVGSGTATTAGVQQTLTKALPRGGKATLLLWVRQPAAGDVTNGPKEFRVELLNGVSRFRAITVPTVDNGLWSVSWIPFSVEISLDEVRDKDLTGIRVISALTPSGTPPKIQVANLTLKYRPPIGVRFWRTANEQREIVRGGDFKKTSSGWARTYDSEAPLGVSSSYAAEPVYSQDGDLVGPLTTSAAMTVPPGNRSTWIKSLENPAYSVQVMISNWSSFGASSYYSTDRVPGTSLPGGVFDAMGGYSGQASFVTMNDNEAERMLQLMNEGMLLIQTDPKYKRPTTMYIIVDSWSRNDFAKMDSDEKVWEVNYTQMERPDTFGQPTRMPNSSFAKRFSDYPTFADVPARTFASAMDI